MYVINTLFNVRHHIVIRDRVQNTFKDVEVQPDFSHFVYNNQVTNKQKPIN